jgi:hypothetical protein
MKPNGSMLGRKLPSAGSLLVGILVGLLVASVGPLVYGDVLLELIDSC